MDKDKLIECVVEIVRDICNDIVDEESGVLPLPDDYWPVVKADVIKQVKDRLNI